MNRKARRCVAIILLVAMSGCSGYRQVAVPPAGPQTPQDPPTLLDVQVGSYVRAHLISGEKVSGQVKTVAAGSLTLERPRNYSFKERVIGIEDIARLEVMEEVSGGDTRFSPVAIVLTTVFALFLAAVSQIDMSGND